jgi:hypothetical protein
MKELIVRRHRLYIGRLAIAEVFLGPTIAEKLQSVICTIRKKDGATFLTLLLTLVKASHSSYLDHSDESSIHGDFSASRGHIW